MHNKKQSKSSLSNAFMVSAIAFVLVMGTGYNSMQSSGLDYNGIGESDTFNGFTQSAECAGLGNDCSEDNRDNNNGPGNGNGNGNGEEPTECELCLDDLSDEQESALLAALNVETLAEACLLVDIDPRQLIADLRAEDLSLELISEILACLGLELPTRGPTGPPGP